MACNSSNAIKCPCTYGCSKHGKCCECIAYHKRAGEFPACLFSEKTEKTYDRSLKALLRDRQS